MMIDFSLKVRDFNRGQGGKGLHHDLTFAFKKLFCFNIDIFFISLSVVRIHVYIYYNKLWPPSMGPALLVQCVHHRHSLRDLHAKHAKAWHTFVSFVHGTCTCILLTYCSINYWRQKVLKKYCQTKIHVYD